MAVHSVENNKGDVETYIVARYTPAGNVKGQFAANVGNKITSEYFNFKD